MRHRKNAALAWRQTIFYLSLASSATVTQFIETNRKIGGLSDGAVQQAEAIFHGLIETAQGRQPSAGPFLGWVTRTDQS